MTDSLRRTSLLFALLALTGLVAASIASAGPPPVIDQYYEEIPTANGGVGGGSGNTGGGSGNSGGGSGNSGGGSGSGGGGLSGPILNQLESSVSPAVASGLQEVATSSRLGAPSAMLEKPAQGGGESASGDTAASGSVSGTVTAATDGGEAHLTILLILIGLITASAVVVAARRRRQTLA
jgi:hypothetical protein